LKIKKKQEPFEKLYSSLLNNEITDIKYLEGMASGMGVWSRKYKRKIKKKIKRKIKRFTTGLRDYFASTIRKQRRDDDMLFTQPLEN